MKKSFTLLVLCAFVILHCATSNQGVKTMEGKGFVDTRLIRGYTQFPVWKNDKENLLGYVSTDEDPFFFQEKFWSGKIRNTPTTQSIDVSYSSVTLAHAKAQFKDSANVEASLSQIQEMNFTFVNPTEVVLEDVKPEKGKLNHPDIKTKKYIAAVLKVDKVLISVKLQDGAELKTEADLKKYKINLGANVKYDAKLNALYSGQNSFVGFKLLNPSKNPDDYK